MASRYVFPVRITLQGDEERASRYVGEARVLLGVLAGELGESNIRSGRRSKRHDDVVIDVSYDGTLGRITIKTGTGSSSSRSSTTKGCTYWVPEGFVFYPASNTSQYGWGVPVVQVGDSIYDAENCAPGLDVTRWTEAGPLGQVLVTRVPGAGYPAQNDQLLTSPLLYYATDGLRPTVAPAVEPSTEWAAYRIEFDPFSTQSPVTDRAESDYIQGFKRRSYELISEYRESIGRTRMMLPIRGFADSAQSSAEIMWATRVQGHYSERFPLTYQTAEERLSKDGVPITSGARGLTASQFNSRNSPFSGGDIVASNGNGFEVIGTDPNGVDIYYVPNSAPPFTAQQAFDLWMSSPPHKATIEREDYDYGGGENVFGQVATCHRVGARVRFYAQHFTLHDQWVGAGNVVWLSKEPEIPALSYYGPNSMNLGWETWVPQIQAYSTKQDDDDYLLSAELIDSSAPFTTPLVIGSATYADNTRISLWESPNPNTYASHFLFGNAIFMRGRCIAVAPYGGLVLAAAVQKIPRDGGFVYRLVALTHQPTAQGGNAKRNGETKVLSIYWVDLRSDDFLSANPESVVLGIYGSEPGADPWIHHNSPYSWRTGPVVDMGTSDSGSEVDMLKYASTWRFSDDGMKAVCLRDHGTYDELCTHLVADRLMKFGNLTTAYTSIVDGDVYYPAGMFGLFTGGPGVVWVELTFGDSSGSLTATRQTSERPRGMLPHYMQDEYARVLGHSNIAGWARPCAVDYDENGNKVFAFHVTGWYGNAAEADDGGSGVYLNNLRQGYVFGDWDTFWGDCVARGRFFSSLIGRTGEDMFAPFPIVIDVKDRVVAVVGRPSPATDVGSGSDDDADHAGYPDEIPEGVDVFHAGYRAAEFSSECMACEPVPTTLKIRLWRGDTLLLDTSVANDGEAIDDIRLANYDDDFITDGAVGVPVPVSNPHFSMHQYAYGSPYLVVSYKVARDGAWALTANYWPQGSNTVVKYVPDDIDSAHFPTNQDGDTFCFNNCGQSIRHTNGIIPPNYGSRSGPGDFIPLLMTSSFATSAELAAMMGVPGGNPRSFYVRLV